MKDSINLINVNQDLNKDLVKKIKNNTKKNFLLAGPWCKNNINYFKENFEDTLLFKTPFKINKYKNNVSFLIKKYEFTLNFLIKKLNKIHNKKSKKKYWEIILGRWLMTWVNHNYFIWDYIIEMNKKINIREIYQPKIKNEAIIPKNTLDSHIKCKLDDSWLEWTFEKIIRYKFPEKKICYINFKKNKKILNKIDNELYLPKLLFVKKSKKIFFYQLELDKRVKIEIFKRFKFLFFQSRKKVINFKKGNSNLRDKVNWDFKKNEVKCNFQRFLLQNLIYGIPKVFLENFEELNFLNNKVNWPKNCEYNITSYAQYYDEFFKLYCAQEKEYNKKFKLCIVQHGYGNFFQKDDFYNVYHDRKISDIYLTWGSHVKINSKPFFYPKLVKKNKVFNENNKKKILFISYSFHSGLHYPISSFENGNFINKNNLIQINNFINKLKANIKKKIYFKNLNENKLKNFEKSLKIKIPSVKFVNKQKNFFNNINDHDIFIHHFLGTPFFECLMMNKPSILLYNKKIHFPIDTKFEKFVKKFEKLGILFRNENRAAKFLNNNFDLIEKWWNGKKLQSTLNKFCNLYCRNVDDPIKIIENTLK